MSIGNAGRRPWQIWLVYGISLLIAVGALGWLSQLVIDLDVAEAKSQARADLEERVGASLWRMDVSLAQLLATEAGRPVVAYEPARQTWQWTNEEALPQSPKTLQSLGPKGLQLEPPMEGEKGVLPSGDGKGKLDNSGRGAKATPPTSSKSSTETSKSKTAWDSNPKLPNVEQVAICSPLMFNNSQLVKLHFEADTSRGFTSPQCPGPEYEQLAFSNGCSITDLRCNRDLLTELETSLDPNKLLARIDDTPVLTTPGELDSNNYAFDPGEQVLVGNSPTQQIELQMQQQAEPMNSPAQRQLPSRSGRRVASRNGNRGDPVEDFQQRFNTLQTATRQSMVMQNRSQNTNEIDMMMQGGDSVTVTRSQPIWDQDRLLLVRQVDIGKRQLVQGCWLDWPAIRKLLLDQIDDLLPKADLRPVYDASSAPVSRMLATLPVALELPDPIITSAWNSPMRIALLVSWACLGFAAFAIAFVLHGAVQLSERRASFVSAVTHELRTPLTTFRMYSEMLAEDMVPEPKRKQYLTTLLGEADRLSHLVENVLHYAKLERSKSGWELAACSSVDLIDAVRERLETRAGGCQLELRWVISEEAKSATVRTNISGLEQVLFNLVDNACKYGRPADPAAVDIELHREGRWLAIHVRDYGPGVTTETARRMFQPFSRKDEVGPAPGVGLGLALCRRLATQLQGRLDFRSESPGARFVVLVPIVAEAV